MCHSQYIHAISGNITPAIGSDASMSGTSLHHFQVTRAFWWLRDCSGEAWFMSLCFWITKQSKSGLDFGSGLGLWSSLLVTFCHIIWNVILILGINSTSDGMQKLASLRAHENLKLFYTESYDQSRLSAQPVSGSPGTQGEGFHMILLTGDVEDWSWDLLCLLLWQVSYSSSMAHKLRHTYNNHYSQVYDFIAVLVLWLDSFEILEEIICFGYRNLALYFIFLVLCAL